MSIFNRSIVRSSRFTHYFSRFTQHTPGFCEKSVWSKNDMKGSEWKRNKVNGSEKKVARNRLTVFKNHEWVPKSTRMLEPRVLLRDDAMRSAFHQDDCAGAKPIRCDQGNAGGERFPRMLLTAALPPCKIDDWHWLKLHRRPGLDSRRSQSGQTGANR